MSHSILTICCSLLLLAQSMCSDSNPSPQTNETKSNKKAAEIDPYWTDGKAEINVYTLEQNRYQDVHQGQLVSIFVREDFLIEKQIKNETYTDQNTTPVLKNIQIRKFPTGLYDYSVFSACFTPFDHQNFPKSIKVSNSAQEWCGTTYMQLNLKDDGYKATLHSYFEKEGDQVVDIPKGVLEDELFNLVRLNPDYLPIGTFDLIPSTTHSRLKHLPLKPYKATGEKSAYSGRDFSGENLQAYTIETAAIQRSMQIVFEGKSPYKIVGWTERFPSAFDGQVRSTKAVLQKQQKLAYWNLNSLADQKLREELGLLPF